MIGFFPGGHAVVHRQRVYVCLRATVESVYLYLQKFSDVTYAIYKVMQAGELSGQTVLTQGTSVLMAKPIDLALVLSPSVRCRNGREAFMEEAIADTVLLQKCLTAVLAQTDVQAIAKHIELESTLREFETLSKLGEDATRNRAESKVATSGGTSVMSRMYNVTPEEILRWPYEAFIEVTEQLKTAQNGGIPINHPGSDPFLLTTVPGVGVM